MQALRATHSATHTVGCDCCRPSCGRPTSPKLTYVIRIGLTQHLGRENSVFDVGGLLVAALYKCMLYSHKPRIGHIFGYMAQNAIPREPTPLATPHFLWFPPLTIAQTDA